MAVRRTVQRTSDGVPLLKAIVYGFGGTGKTTFAFTFNQDERTAPALVLNASGNPDWAMSLDPGIVVLDLETYEDIDLPFAFLHAGQPEKHSFRRQYDIPSELVFKTLVIDTFSDWQIKMIESMTGDPVALSDARAPTLRERSPIKSKTIKSARELLTNLNLHVVLVTQETTKINIEGGTESSLPWIDGGARDIIPSWANFVGHMTNKAIEKNIMPVLTWRSASVASYTKNQWVPTIEERGLAGPTATKLLNLASKYLGGN